MAKYGGHYFEVDRSGRLCRLSRADRNRLDRGLDVRVIGARPWRSGGTRLRDWHRAFADLPPDVVLVAFEWKALFSWTLTLRLVDSIDSQVITFGAGFDYNYGTRLATFKRGRCRAAAVVVADAVRQLRGRAA